MQYKFTKLHFLMSLVIIIYIIIIIVNNIKNKKILKQQEITRFNDTVLSLKIKAQFHPVERYHFELVKFTKNMISSPKTFRHLHTSYYNEKNHLIIKMSFIFTNTNNLQVIKVIKVQSNIQTGKIVKTIYYN